MAVLFVNEDKLKSSTAINYNVDTAFLLPFLKIAQDKHLQYQLIKQIKRGIEFATRERLLLSRKICLIEDL